MAKKDEKTQEELIKEYEETFKKEHKLSDEDFDSLRESTRKAAIRDKYRKGISDILEPKPPKPDSGWGED